MDSWNTAKKGKPERNFQLGLLAKIVSCEKNFEPLPGNSYLQRNRTVIAARLATLEAKKNSKQMRLNALRRTKTGKKWRGGGEKKDEQGEGH